MTEKHRKRFVLALLTSAVTIVFMTLPIASSGDIGATLVVAAVSVVFAATILSIIGYIWSANDREDAGRDLPPPPHDR